MSEDLIIDKNIKQKNKEQPLFELLHEDVNKPELINGYYHIPIYLNKVTNLDSYLNDNEKTLKRVDDINEIKSITLTYGERVVIPTGIKINITDNKKIYSTTISELLLTKHLFCTTFIDNNQLMIIVINNSKNKVRLENNDKCVLFSLI
jgi:dUTPase